MVCMATGRTYTFVFNLAKLSKRRHYSERRERFIAARDPKNKRQE